MDYVFDFGVAHVAFALVIGAVLVGTAWWMLADFILAFVDLPFHEPLARSRSRDRAPDPDDAETVHA